MGARVGAYSTPWWRGRQAGGPQRWTGRNRPAGLSVSFAGDADVSCRARTPIASITVYSVVCCCAARERSRSLVGSTAAAGGGRYEKIEMALDRPIRRVKTRAIQSGCATGATAVREGRFSNEFHQRSAR